MRVHFPSLAGVAENCTAGRGGGGEGGTEAAPSIINSGILGGPGLFLLDTKHVCTERASRKSCTIVLCSGQQQAPAVGFRLQRDSPVCFSSRFFSSSSTTGAEEQNSLRK